MGDRDEANRIKDEHVHCLGNLTLSGYNSRLSNRPFADKQGHEEMTALGHSIQIGYNNNLALNNIKFPISRRKFTLATIEGWSEEAILSRNEVLDHQACNFYKFDDEQIHEIDVEDKPKAE